MLFTDGGKSVGMSFAGTSTSTPLTFTASAISGTELTSLESTLASGQHFLSGWDFTAGSGYASGSPVYLSLFAGAGQSLSGLEIWHFDGSTWSEFSATDLAYDSTYASFTATGFSGYAVSGAAAPVPVPAALLLFAPGLAGIVGLRRKLRK
jgi:hypothetical protein